jgi:hypothetical protein
VILEEFLPPQELESLIQDTLRRESEFHVSEVVSPGVNGGAPDFEHRRSRVLLDIGKHGAALAASVKARLPRVLPKLGYEPFPISRLEAQITASNDGDFFRWHNDNAQKLLLCISSIASRKSSMEENSGFTTPDGKTDTCQPRTTATSYRARTNWSFSLVVWRTKSLAWTAHPGRLQTADLR